MGDDWRGIIASGSDRGRNARGTAVLIMVGDKECLRDPCLTLAHSMREGSGVEDPQVGVQFYRDCRHIVLGKGDIVKNPGCLLEPCCSEVSGWFCKAAWRRREEG